MSDKDWSGWTLTCHNKDCPDNYDLPIFVWVDPEWRDMTANFMCGACGTEITDAVRT